MGGIPDHLPPLQQEQLPGVPPATLPEPPDEVPEQKDDK